MAHSPTRTFLARPISDLYILGVSAASLSIFGIIMVFSASSIHGLDSRGSAIAIVLRQLGFLAIGLILVVGAVRTQLKSWKRIARFGLLISCIILLLVRIPGVGKSVNGNTNWISLGIVDVQPSELAKFLMILWAGFMLAARERSGQNRTSVLLLIAPGFALILVLIMLGKDLGTAAVVAAILAGLLFTSGIELRVMGSFVLAAAVVATYFIITESYRATRLTVVLNPFADSEYKNVGWQPAHSILGLASGGIFGVGLGGSRQKWGNLAEAHTDFIFSVIGEELGLFGTLAVLALLGALIFSIFRIALRAPEPMVRYVSAGVACWIAIQTILNIGSATSLLPVVGVTLPLVSYGGSALIATLLGIGFVLGAVLRDPDVKYELQENAKKRRAKSSLRATS